MNRRTAAVAIGRMALGAVVAVAACQPASTVAPMAGGGLADPESGGIVVLVTSNGWHTGIVIARADLPAGRVPEAVDFPEAPYLEFGWGDAEFYPAPRPTVGAALRAALQPSPALVHLIGLPAHPRDVFPTAEVAELRLTSGGFRRLADYLDASFARDGAERAAATAPGLYRFSRFYPATGEFHLFNTCNTWAAKGLETAGVPVQASGTFRAEDLMAQLRPIARGEKRP